MGWDLACNRKRKSNIEQGMSKATAIWQRKNFVIRNSLFDIRYSFQAHGKPIILELRTAEESAKPLIKLGMLIYLKLLRSGATLAPGLSASRGFLRGFFRKLIDVFPAEIFSEFLAHFFHPSGNAARIIFIKPG
jgi:hypothetical protein